MPETPSGTLAGSEDSGAADDGSIASQSGSRAARFLAGATAMLLPQTVGERLGIIEIRGGRGLMWFTDLDTLIFDCLLVLIVVLLFRRARAASLRNPVFWLVVVMVVAVGAPLAYTVTNFGTLFRLRGMVYTGLALIPIALLTAGIRAEPKAPPDEPSDAAA